MLRYHWGMMLKDPNHSCYSKW